MKNNWTVLGIMSGTSLDGVDLACCRFSEDHGKWEYSIQEAVTIPYKADWAERLRNVENASAFEYVRTDIGFGHYLGQLAGNFIAEHSLRPDLIASHGHTVFHRPEQQITSQIGQGAAIAAETGFPVACDFRTTDVALNGQGAPLVPIGDRLLFSAFDYCLNLGGFANISYEMNGNRIAFDVCPVNIVMNYFSAKAGLPYDKGGALAQSGIICPELLTGLNSLPYYSLAPPKSLGKEWVLKNVLPFMTSFDISEADQLSTFCSHISDQVSGVIENDYGKRMLVTGGGAWNSFLISEIQKKTKTEICIPDEMTVNFKEALIFAFLGVLRLTNRLNCLASVTGADKDSIGGAVYLH